ncbi:d2.2 [Ichnoviriform fugitivi]|uniref:D2.2 n=1 Tax=Ichnoviriform fugitivi TaxID=265522 RepID=A2Q0J5_9VIRU|nr:d2.2 [Ichnoviriform fugitivi]BAF45710.1 d2.2 [Ichnoviriform fugitivi]
MINNWRAIKLFADSRWLALNGQRSRRNTLRRKSPVTSRTQQCRLKKLKTQHLLSRWTPSRSADLLYLMGLLSASPTFWLSTKHIESFLGRCERWSWLSLTGRYCPSATASMQRGRRKIAC